MQSLGKVPSARRPPANLPSLKAETSSPAPTQSNDQQQQQQQTTNASSASWADQNPIGASAPIQVNQAAPSQLNTSGGQSHQTQTGGNSSSATSSNTSWSAVATGGNVKEENSSQPPLYQSPQFQNEFPSLDGSSTSSASAPAPGQKQQNPNSNSLDTGGDQMNLRPSTDAASWMQQQQQSNSGSARGGGGENGPQANYQQPEIPTKFMALMPSFMLRGAQGGSGMNPTNSSSSHPQTQPSNQNSGSNSGSYQNQARSGRNSSHYGSSYNNNNNNDYNNRDSGPPRHRQAPPPRHSTRHNDDRSSSYEPEIIVQRPIIKEEELERIDSLARDEGWSKHDEIDYNKKIQFSDDEPDDPKDNDKKLDGELMVLWFLKCQRRL